jgi:hypothetical protein
MMKVENGGTIDSPLDASNYNHLHPVPLANCRRSVMHRAPQSRASIDERRQIGSIPDHLKRGFIGWLRGDPRTIAV